MKKTTMNDIADSLNISRVTVWKALNGHPGVSAPLRTKIRDKADELGYSNPKTAPATENRPMNQTVSIVVTRPKSSLFWMNIIHEIAEEFSNAGFNLMYCNVPSEYTHGFKLPNTLVNGSVQGIIVLNVYDETLIDMLNKLSIPKIFLDVVTNYPIEDLTGDLVLLDGKSNTYQITDRLIKKNYQPIGFVGDIAYALTNQMRYEGFLAAMSANRMEVDPHLCFTGRIGIYSYYEKITAFIKGLEQMPKSFVCVSDYAAHFLARVLNDNGYKTPLDVTLTGFDGNVEYTNVIGLTTVRVNTEALGRCLTHQLRYRIEYPSAPIEVINVHSKIIWSHNLV